MSITIVMINKLIHFDVCTLPALYIWIFLFHSGKKVTIKELKNL